MALAHRLLRDMPADGEKVLSKFAAERDRGRQKGSGACSPMARSTWPRMPTALPA